MATTKKATLNKAEKEAKKRLAKERKSLRRRDLIIKKLDLIYKSIEKIKDDDCELQNSLSKKMISKALKHIESAMLCIHQY